LDTNRGNYPGTAYEKAPDAKDATLITPGVTRSAAGGILQKLPFRGLLMRGVSNINVGLVAVPWVPQVTAAAADAAALVVVGGTPWGAASQGCCCTQQLLLHRFPLHVAAACMAAGTAAVTAAFFVAPALRFK
jgi:hypothetical protein